MKRFPILFCYINYMHFLRSLSIPKTCIFRWLCKSKLYENITIYFWSRRYCFLFFTTTSNVPSQSNTHDQVSGLAEWSPTSGNTLRSCPVALQGVVEWAFEGQREGASPLPPNSPLGQLSWLCARLLSSTPRASHLSVWGLALFYWLPFRIFTWQAHVFPNCFCVLRNLRILYSPLFISNTFNV